jgi:5'-phosphate synthase pdxT subunit
VKIGVLGLQGDVREHVRSLEEAGAAPLVVKQPSEVADIDGLVIPGGESTTIGKLMDRFGLIEPISQRATSGMPVYGTCAGMILMARAVTGDHDAPHRLGLMDITVRRNAFGRQVDSFEADIDVVGLGDPFRAVFIRAPSVQAAGQGVEVMATYEGIPVLVRQGPHMASSFHPEMSGDSRIHELFLAGIEA